MTYQSTPKNLIKRMQCKTNFIQKLSILLMKGEHQWVNLLILHLMVHFKTQRT